MGDSSAETSVQSHKPKVPITIDILSDDEGGPSNQESTTIDKGDSASETKDEKAEEKSVVAVETEEAASAVEENKEPVKTLPDDSKSSECENSAKKKRKTEIIRIDDDEDEKKNAKDQAGVKMPDSEPSKHVKVIEESVEKSSEQADSTEFLEVVREETNSKKIPSNSVSPVDSTEATQPTDPVNSGSVEEAPEAEQKTDDKENESKQNAEENPNDDIIMLDENYDNVEKKKSKTNANQDNMDCENENEDNSSKQQASMDGDKLPGDRNKPDSSHSDNTPPTEEKRKLAETNNEENKDKNEDVDVELDHKPTNAVEKETGDKNNDDIMDLDSDSTNAEPTDKQAQSSQNSLDKQSEADMTDEACSKSENNTEQTKPDLDKPKVLEEDNKPQSSDQTPAKKQIVLDEKLGTFAEKDALPEEKVPVLITGDSDEDVVMIEDDDQKDPKGANLLPKKTEPTSSTASKGPIPKVDAKQEKPSRKVLSIDCVNPECKKDCKETAPAPAFVLNFFGVPKKSKRQRVCMVCYDDVLLKYSNLCGMIMDQQPLLFCELPQKNELVEISDSSEEEEDEEIKKEVEKPLEADIISLVESELNDILTDTFEKINLNQQIDWTEQIMTQRIAYNTKLSNEINNELSELQRKVDRIHLQLYSKSRPRYQDLPPCNIYHEVDLVNKSQLSSSCQTPQRTQQQAKQTLQTSTSAQSVVSSTPQAGIVAKKEDLFIRPAIVVGQFYFAVKHKLLSNWAECQIVEAVTVSDKCVYKVNFLFNQGANTTPVKVVPARYLAYRHSFNVKLPLGTRVIARFDAGTTQPTQTKQPSQTKTCSFYPGIIAESFGKYNRQRYLIFFDDGYAQYVGHGDVRVVCEESKEVWMDIHPHSQEFIKNYLANFRSQRPMVQVKVGQRIITEWKGKWIYAKVVDIDASLVQLHFPDDNRYEWIYRGSTRLGPLYQEKALSMGKMSNNKFSKFQKRNEPSIEYITIDDDDDAQNKQQDVKKPTPQEQALQSYNQQNKSISPSDAVANRSVAKKSTTIVRTGSTSSSQPSAVFMNSSTIYCEDDRPKGKIVYYTAKKHLPPLKYKQHECNPNCLFKITHNLKSYSPLAKPLLSGWERQLCKMKYKKVFVVYRAPCGRRLRNMYELHKYIRMTKATLNVDNFDFDPMVHCLAEYVIENHIYHNPDISDGREFMAVPCVNYFDDSKPPPCIYSTERIPSEGVKLNLDTDFLCGCDCEDDCLDKTRCQCWQLTIAGAKFGNPTTSIDNIGYVYKRLQETVVTGIYECNARCKCNSSCLNRVVQHPLQTKLQVFKTSNRGWGIRCLNDVSKGSFICIYSGHLLTEEAGNMICQMNANKAGDEYFADLDYIETVEQLKEGYETDVVESDSELDSDEAEYDAKRDTDASDDDFTTSCNPSKAAVKTRSQVRRDSTKKTDPKRQSKKKEDNGYGSDDEREMVNLVPNSDMTKGDESSPSIKYRSVRKLFGKHEQIYIMDAKKSGNLGRYFNHSCNPNLFVQNVFVDTHDLRFPWVAFFALSNVRAGSELTWNYNYDVGSVPGKVLYCQCGAENCRQRLL
ncbi:histone-lysine N-methyltransferase eggless [Toxorhynchites rutilus septentrionalis]|uniref:histone-lysine N-methyltransferase eggless n=1 Tax=Toxorhynchites rutilus septentrionalis TaxID=329112 RepID=UPI00247B21DC|nr:histone-lysine N-methyltransferase eggless [Toxorhynchites rutilus septentrionalis]